MRAGASAEGSKTATSPSAVHVVGGAGQRADALADQKQQQTKAALSQYSSAEPVGAERGKSSGPLSRGQPLQFLKWLQQLLAAALRDEMCARSLA